MKNHHTERQTKFCLESEFCNLSVISGSMKINIYACFRFIKSWAVSWTYRLVQNMLRLQLQMLGFYTRNVRYNLCDSATHVCQLSQSRWWWIIISIPTSICHLVFEWSPKIQYKPGLSWAKLSTNWNPNSALLNSRFVV